MAQKQGKAPVNVLDISSSEDEDIVGAASRGSSSRGQRSQPREKQEQILQNPRTLAASIGVTSQKPCLQSQSFWKAGNYEICPSKSAPVHGLLEHARVHPKFLHSNATSHKWAFGAIAELLDNAVDEISSGATYVKVDKIDIMKDNSPALLFQDDGGGMNPEGIRKCMSLGYSSKKTNTTIGQYGNGFKTSTMRLGADVIVFSRATNASRATQSVGLLSYTFLRKTGQDDVIVPMVDFDVSDHWAEPIIFSSQDDWSANLKNILEWSPFRLKEDLMLQFEDIGRHGTKIIIYNLWLNDEGIYELSFDDDEEDIRLRDEARHGSVSRIHKRVLELQSHISYRILYSLRAYASILYLKKFKNFQIILRGKPVQLYSIAEDLKHSKIVIYRPQVGTSKEVAVETTLGFIKEAPTLGVTGFNIYHKNRLIRPFWKVTSDGSSQGYGVVGVLEANFIEPAHDKQDFERSSLFTRLESKLKQLLLEYWRNHRHLLDYHVSNSNMDMAKERSAHSIAGLATTTPKKRPAGQHVHLNQPIGGLASNWGSHLSNVHTGVCRTDVQNELASAQPLLGLAAASGKEVASVDGATVNKLCKENIQLFMRCEEHKQKENELEHMIGELEKELEEAKTKSSHLSLLLESHRKQKLEEKTWAV